MRLLPLMSAALVLCVSGPAFAQGWTRYLSRADFFSASFPSEPEVQDITYQAEYRITLPGCVYTVENRGSRYSVTVVNYADAVAIHQERVKSCTAAGGDGDICQDDGPEEMRGAIVYASWNFINRDGSTVTHYAHYNSDRVESHEIHLTNADRSRTSAVIHMHENRLYNPGGNRAARCAGAGAVSGIRAIPRPGVEPGALRVGRHSTLLQRIPTTPARQGAAGPMTLVLSR